MVSCLLHTTQHKDDLRTTLVKVSYIRHSTQVLLVSECTECSPQELSTASCSSQRDNTCTHIPPLVTILNVALVLSCSSTIIPSVLISNYALLAIYPVTVPNHANYNQYHDHVLLGLAHSCAIFLFYLGGEI